MRLSVLACVVLGCRGAAPIVYPPLLADGESAPAPAPATPETAAAAPAPAPAPAPATPAASTDVQVAWPTSWNQPSMNVLAAGEGASVALAVSGDSSTVVGFLLLDGKQQVPVRWRAGRRVTLPSSERAAAMYTSFDGKVIAGSSRVWIDDEPVAAPQDASIAGVLADGTLFGERGEAAELVTWSRGSAGYAAPVPMSLAGLAPIGISSDRKVVGGYVGGPVEPEIAYRTGARTVVLGRGFMNAMTRDGKAFVGEDGTDAFVYHGKRKTLIDRLPGTKRCHPRGIADDGARVVGECEKTGGGTTAFLWDAGAGTRELAAVVKSSVPLVTARSICARGVTVVGTVLIEAKTQAYVVIVPR